MKRPFYSEEMDPVLADMAEDDLRGLVLALEDSSMDMLGSVFFFIFLKSNVIVDLERGIDSEEKYAAGLSSPDDQAVCWNRMSRMITAKYKSTGKLDDIELAIQWTEKAVEATAPDHANYVPHLYTQTLMRFKKYEHTKSIKDLERTILTAEEAVFSASPADPVRTKPLEFLATSLAKRQEKTGSTEELERAILLASEVLTVLSDDSKESKEPMVQLITKLETRRARETAGTRNKEHADHSTRLSQHAFVLMNKFEQTGKLNDLDEAMSAMREAAQVAQEEIQRARCLANLGNMFTERFRTTGQMVDLDQATAIAEQAVKMCSETDPDYPGLVNNLCFKLKFRYEETGNVEDLENAITKAEKVLDLMVEKNTVWVALQTNLGSMFMRRHSFAGGKKDIEKAIHCTKGALEITIKNGRSPTGILNNLSTMYGELFGLTRNADDLELAIQYMKQVVNTPPKTGSELREFTGYCMNLSNLYMQRYEYSDGIKDLQATIEVLKHALHVAAKDDRKIAPYFYRLSHLLRTYYLHTRLIGDLNESIKAGQKAVDMAPEGQPKIAEWLESLASMYQERFDQTGSFADLEKAIKHAENAVSATTVVNDKWAHRVSTLGALYSARFEEKGEINDLNEAIEKSREAVSAMSDIDGESELADHLSILSRMLKVRFEATENEEDLEEAINNATLAVTITPKGHPNLSYHHINVGSALRVRFGRAGQITDLEEAIRNGEEAVNAERQVHPTPAEIRTFASYQVSLGNWLHDRYDQIGRLEDLEAAIHQTELGIQRLAAGDSAVANACSNLGRMFEERYHRTKNIEDLNDAVSQGRQAVDKTPENHPKRPNYLNSLSAFLATRFEMTQNIGDLNEAIENMEHVIRVSHGQPRLWSYLSNMSTLLKNRYELSGRREDMEDAIRYIEQAVTATPETHPRYSGYLQNLGLYYSLIPDESHQERAIEAYLRGWESKNGIPINRILCARQAIQLLKKKKDWAKASEIAKQAVGLLPVMNNRSLDRADQQHLVSRFSGVAADACSLALQVGDSPSDALELLELGRGVIMGLLIDDRSDLSALTASNPEKANKFKQLRDIVNPSHQSEEDSKSSLALITKRLEAFRELNHCLDEIRLLPGFERFQLGLSQHEMKECAKEGPIVLVNITSVRSDAIVVTSSNIEALHLPELTMDKTVDWLGKNLTVYNNMDEFRKNNIRYREFLSWLWDKCVSPIVSKLEEGGTKPSLDGLPRVWWVGIGVASFLPFHAAGNYTNGKNQNAYNRMISSYIPTIKALAHTRRSTKLASSSLSADSSLQLLMVAMPTTPGERPLAGVEKEILAVQKSVHGEISVNTMMQPSAKEVLANLGDYDIVHFACHGALNTPDPSNSSLLLQKSGDQHSQPELDRLTVRQVSGVSSNHARLAYLSACSTAQNVVSQLVDEVIHLASAFQVAGFQHVIGSMWPSDDSVCIEVAQEFYERLKVSQFTTEAHGEAHGEAGVAAALHASMTTVISKRRKLPLLWAQYIHLGP